MIIHKNPFKAIKRNLKNRVKALARRFARGGQNATAPTTEKGECVSCLQHFSVSVLEKLSCGH